MFDRIYQRPIIVAQHRDGPWADERARYLSHLETEGRAPGTLKAIGAILLAVARHIDGRMPAAATDADIARFVNSWGDAQSRPSRPLHSPEPARARRRRGPRPGG
jgi:integrase/recombinase XerD